MKTFTKLKALAENPQYRDQRRKALSGLSDNMIDEPIIGLVNNFNKLPYCFTLQSCYGHFVYTGQEDPHNLESLPHMDAIAEVEYRIAYVAFCVENSALGELFLEALRKIVAVDPENIQLACAEWFWERQVNSYVLQVEPDRFKFEDRALLEYGEALKIERIRNKFFVRLGALLQKRQEGGKSG